MMDRDELAALDAAVLTLRHSVVKFGGVSQPTICDKIADGIRALIDENARLREANGILEDALQEVGDDYPGSSCQQWCQHQVKAARAALSPNPEQQED